MEKMTAQPPKTPDLMEQIENISAVAHEVNLHTRECLQKLVGTVPLDASISADSKWEKTCVLSLVETLRDVTFETVQLMRTLKEII